MRIYDANYPIYIYSINNKSDEARYFVLFLLYTEDFKIIIPIFAVLLIYVKSPKSNPLLPGYYFEMYCIYI